MTENPYQSPTENKIVSENFDRGWSAGFKCGCQISNLLVFLAIFAAIVSWFQLMARLKFGP
jgi:hypothetical protein